MSENIRITNQYGGTLIVRNSGDGLREIVPEQSSSQFTIPFHQAALIGFLSELLGRKIAAIVYEDELPAVSATRHGVLASNGSNADPDNAEQARQWALGYFAIARHIEARDAAAKEAEHAEEERVEAKEWWVTTGPVAGDGQKVAGPYPTRDHALNARALIEAALSRDDLWIDDAPAREATQ